MARKIQPRSKIPKPKSGQSSEDYWRERESRQRAENIRNEAKTAERINRIFRTMQDSIQQEIEAFYQRYASKEGITLTEARGRVSRIDMEQYERLAKKYVEAAHHGDEDIAFSQEANDQMRLYNATMRINRLEMLKARCGIRAMEGYRDTERLINENLEERAYSEYSRLAGILGNSVQFNENMVRAIVNASYQNANWSQRLWNHQASLSSQIGTQLASGILAGKSSTVLAREIQKVTQGSTYACQRLMRTELRRVQTDAAEQSMMDNGVDEYKYLVANGVNPCDECLALDGQVFKLSDMNVGKNAPPRHPGCHCCTCPAVDEAKWQRWLDGPAQAGVPWADFESEKVEVKKEAKPDPGYTVRAAKHTFTGGKTTDAKIYTTPDGTEFIFPEKYSRKKQRMTPEKAIELWNRTPEKLRKQAQKRVEFVDYYNPSDSYWRKTYKNFSHSYATGGETITFYRFDHDHDDDYVVRTYCHEGGHYIDTVMGKDGQRFSNGSVWTKAMADDKIESGRESPTEYGKNSNVEDFAESVAEYVRDKEAFTKRFPNRASILSGSL